MRKTQVELQSRWAEKKIHDPLWQEIIARYQAGESAKRLGLIYGQKPQTVRGVVSRLNLRDTPGIREMERLYNGGCSLEEIGRLFDISRQAVWNRLRSRAKMRPAGWHKPAGWADMIARGEW